MALYFAEVLPNIHAVRAYIRLNQKQRPFDPAQLLVTPHHLLYSQATVSLPVPVDPTSAIVTYSPDSDLVDLKLQCCQPQPQPQPAAHVTPPFSAKDLAALCSLGCASCLRQLAPVPVPVPDSAPVSVPVPAATATAASPTAGPSFQHIKNLPSEHWLELIDCWLCHEDQDQKQYANKLRDIGAQAGTLLVGNTYFLLHPDDMVEKSVQRDRDAPKIDVSSHIFFFFFHLFIVCFAETSNMDYKKASITSHAIPRSILPVLDQINTRERARPIVAMYPCSTVCTRIESCRANFY